MLMFFFGTTGFLKTVSVCFSVAAAGEGSKYYIGNVNSLNVDVHLNIGKNENQVLCTWKSVENGASSCTSASVGDSFDSCLFSFHLSFLL